MKEDSSFSAVIDAAILQDEPEMTHIIRNMRHLAAVNRNVGPAITFR